MPDINAITGLFKLAVVVMLIILGYFHGRRNEKRHLKELTEREKQFRDVLVFATRYPPTSDVILDPVLVSGAVVVASDHFKMFVAGLRKMFGGRFHAYEMLASRARREAILRMKEQAKNAGCGMVFNVRIQTTRIAGTQRGGGIAAVEALVYGTAFAPAQGSVADSGCHYQPEPWLEDEKRIEMFDLVKNPATRGVLWGLPLVTLYYFAELFGMQDYTYAGDAPVSVLACLALLAVIGLFVLFYKYDVPAGESIVLCILSGLAVVAVAYFGALRINSMTDMSPLSPSVYVLQRNGQLQPKEAGLPELKFNDTTGYWFNQPVGSEHAFTLRRGILGFWQYNQDEYYQKLRAYFDRHPLKR